MQTEDDQQPGVSQKDVKKSGQRNKKSSPGSQF